MKIATSDINCLESEQHCEFLLELSIFYVEPSEVLSDRGIDKHPVLQAISFNYDVHGGYTHLMCIQAATGLLQTIF